jgi:hypothetical protein
MASHQASAAGFTSPSVSKASKNSFYAWHWYGTPTDPEDAVKSVKAISHAWDVPSVLTEFMSCAVWSAATDSDMSLLYWHYSAYCNTGPDFGNLSVPDQTYGACILGWGGGTSSYSCPSR